MQAKSHIGVALLTLGCAISANACADSSTHKMDREA